MKRLASGLLVPETWRAGPPPPPPPPPPSQPFPTAFWKSGLPPILTSFTPPGGSTAGGTSVGLTGLHFTGASAVDFITFGGTVTHATSFVVNSDVSITAVAPALAADIYIVRVSNGAGHTALSSLAGWNTLPCTEWVRGPGVVAPFTTSNFWTGLASGGTSGSSHDQRNSNRNNPGVGPTLNGISSQRYTNVGAAVENTVSANATAWPNPGSIQASDLLSTTQFTVIGVAELFSTAAQGGLQPYDVSGICSTDAPRMGAPLCDHGLGCYIYDGSTFPSHFETFATGAPRKFCIRFGGPVGAGKVQIDVDGVAGTPTTLGLGSISAGLATPIRTGWNNFDGNAFDQDFALWDRMTFDTSITDAQRNDVFSYFTAIYGV